MSRIDKLEAMLAIAGKREASADALPQDELRFVVESEDLAGIGNKLELRLGSAFSLKPLEGVRGFLVLRFPDLDRTLPGHEVFQLAHELRDLLQVRSVEPELGTAFFLDTRHDDGLGRIEATQILDAYCWVEGIPPDNRQWALDACNVPQAWKLSKGKGVVIGHLDTGLADHEDLKLISLDESNAADFVLGTRPGAKDPLIQGSGNPGHGVATASIAVSGGNGKISGVSPEATLLPIRCIQDVKVFNGAPIAAAIAHAASSGAQVITMSLGGIPSRAVHRAIKDAVDDGRIVVAASGNCINLVVWPARYPEVIAVAGSNSLGAFWKGTSRGNTIDIAAPAEHVWHGLRTRLEDPLDGVFPGQGTSFATAVVAGASALWISRHGGEELKHFAATHDTTVQDMFREALRKTARKTAGWPAKGLGPGILDAEALLQLPLAETLGGKTDGTNSIVGFLEEEGDVGEIDPGFDYEAYSAELAWIALGQSMGGHSLRELEQTGKTTATRPSAHLSRSASDSSDTRLRRFASIRGMTTVDAGHILPTSAAGLGAPAAIGGKPSMAAALEAAGIPKDLNTVDALSKRLSSSKLSPAQRKVVERSLESAVGGLRDGRVTPTDRYVLEALVELVDRPAIRVRNGRVDWEDENAGKWADRIYLMALDPDFSELLRAVGRIEADGVHVGSGFVVGPGLIMTNRHVAQQLAVPVPTLDDPKGWELIEDGWIDFADDPGIDQPGGRFRIKSVVWTGRRHIDFNVIDFSRPDVALLEVEEVNGANVALPTPLQIVKKAPVIGREVFLVGYPAQPSELPRLDGRIDTEVAEVLATIFRRDYGAKYFSPGAIVTGRTQASGLALLKHDSTTLGGSSGSTLFSWLDPMQAFGLHVGGLSRTENYAHLISGLASAGGLPSHLLDWI